MARAQRALPLALVALLASAWMCQLACAQPSDEKRDGPGPHDGPHGGPHGPHEASHDGPRHGPHQPHDGPRDGPHGHHGPHHGPDGEFDGPGPHPPPPHPWLPPWLAHLVCPPPPPPPFGQLHPDAANLAALPRPGFEAATGPYVATAIAADSAGAADGGDRPPHPRPPPHPPLPLPAWMTDMLCGPPPPRPGAGAEGGINGPRSGHGFGGPADDERPMPFGGPDGGGPRGGPDSGPHPPTWFMGWMDWLSGSPPHPRGDGPCPRARAFGAAGADPRAMYDGEGLMRDFDIQHPDDEVEMEAAIAAALEAEMAARQQQQQVLQLQQQQQQQVQVQQVEAAAVTKDVEQQQVLRVGGGSADPHAGRAGRGVIGSTSRRRALRAGRL